MRMINADDLEQALREAGLTEVIKDDCSKCTSAWGVPIVDAEEVVRCKDCKKYIPCQKLPIGTSKWCDLFDRATCEMNYCGWGERREDGNN